MDEQTFTVPAADVETAYAEALARCRAERSGESYSIVSGTNSDDTGYVRILATQDTIAFVEGVLNEITTVN